MLYFVIILFMLINIHGIEEELFNQENFNAYGTRLAVNEYIAIFVENDLKRLTIVVDPFSSKPQTDFLPYNEIGLYNTASLSIINIHNIAAGTEPNNNHSVFAFIGEDTNNVAYLVVVFVPLGYMVHHYVLWRELTWPYLLRDLALCIDPQSEHVSIASFDVTLYLDINSNTSTEYYALELWEKETYIFPRALAATKDHRLFLLAYRLGSPTDKNPVNIYHVCLYAVDLSNISNPISLGIIEFSKQALTMDFSTQHQYSMWSISLYEESNMIIVGFPHLDTVAILSYQEKSKSFVIIKKHVSLQKGTLFGKSVAILDNTTYAVLVYSVPTLPWSSSQVQVYSVYDMETDPKPIFIFPNNQQPIPRMNILPPPYRILSFVSWSSHSFGLVLDPTIVLLLRPSPPGYCSSLIKRYVSTVMGLYTSDPCISGTYQNKTSFGPCIICPYHSKNNGSSGITCDTCSTTNTSLCFPGAASEIDMTKLTSYDQANPYPESLESTQFDDLLLQNILKFPIATRHCLFISPVFWACLTIIVCLIFFITIKFLLSRSKYKDRQKHLRKIFVHVDLIGEGQFWLGGLISLSLFVLIVFACKFSISFAYLYPFEQTSSDQRMSVSCDSTLFNGKFSSALHLLSTHKHQEEKPIFTLLDEQNINLSVQFVSTAFTCNDLAIQQSRDYGLSIPLTNIDCFANSSILNISTSLPQHVVTMQFDLTGPHFVGGLRVSFSAPSVTAEEGKYTAEQMDYCQFFFVPNQTLTSNPTMTVKMIKVINRTASMALQDDVIYKGLWVPTLTVTSLTDDILFWQKGGSYRYLSTQTILVIEITESEFYMKNTQEPIARTYEITFTTILFSMLCLDLFGLLFIVFKLAILPLIILVQNCCSDKMKKRSSSVKNIKTNSEATHIGHSTYSVATPTLSEITHDDGKSTNDQADSRRRN